MNVFFCSSIRHRVLKALLEVLNVKHHLNRCYLVFSHVSVIPIFSLVIRLPSWSNGWRLCIGVWKISHLALLHIIISDDYIEHYEVFIHTLIWFSCLTFVMDFIFVPYMEFVRIETKTEAVNMEGDLVLICVIISIILQVLIWTL